MYTSASMVSQPGKSVSPSSFCDSLTTSNPEWLLSLSNSRLSLNSVSCCRAANASKSMSLAFESSTMVALCNITVGWGPLKSKLKLTWCFACSELNQEIARFWDSKSFHTQSPLYLWAMLWQCQNPQNRTRKNPWLNLKGSTYLDVHSIEESY